MPGNGFSGRLSPQVPVPSMGCRFHTFGTPGRIFRRSHAACGTCCRDRVSARRDIWPGRGPPASRHEGAGWMAFPAGHGIRLPVHAAPHAADQPDGIPPFSCLSAGCASHAVCSTAIMLARPFMIRAKARLSGFPDACKTSCRAMTSPAGPWRLAKVMPIQHMMDCVIRLAPCREKPGWS